MFDKMWKTFAVVQEPPKKQTTQISKPKQEALPNDISARILDLQIQMQRDDFPKDLVDQLLNAYTEAVQFYQERGNPRYKLYQKRMKDFLRKPVIYKLLQGQTNLVTIKREQAYNQEIKRASNRTKQQVNKILSRTSDIADRQKQKINQSLEQQQCSLQQRMRKRKIMSNHSVISQVEESDFNEESAKKQKKMDINFLIGGMQPRANRRRVLL